MMPLGCVSHVSMKPLLASSHKEYLKISLVYSLSLYDACGGCAMRINRLLRIAFIIACGVIFSAPGFAQATKKPAPNRADQITMCKM
jgi:hypothetical protein